MVKYDQYHTKEELLSSHFQDRLGYSAAIPTVVPVATDNTKRREARAGLATQIIFLRAQALEEKRALGERSNEEIAQLYEDIQSDSILPEKKLIDSKHFIIPTNNSGSYYSNPKTIDHQFQPIPIIPRDPLECRELPSHFQQRAYPPTATGEARSAGIRLLFTSPAFNIAVVLLEILIHIFCAILSKSKNQVNFVSTATLLLWSTMDVLAFIRMTVAMMDDMVARFIVALHLGIGGVDPAKYLRELKPKNKNSFIYFLAGKASTFFGTNSLTNMRDLLGYYVGTAIDWSERYGHHMYVAPDTRGSFPQSWFAGGDRVSEPFGRNLRNKLIDVTAKVGKGMVKRAGSITGIAGKGKKIKKAPAGVEDAGMDSNHDEDDVVIVTPIEVIVFV